MKDRILHSIPAVTILLFSLCFSPALPQTNTRLESHWAAGPCKEICLTEHFAFASFGGTLAVIDLHSHSLLASLSLPQTIDYMAIHQQTLYAAVANTGLLAIDITDVQAMTARLCAPDRVGRLIIRDRLLYAAGNKSIRMYDITVPMTATPIGSLELPEYTFDIALRDGYLYYAAYSAGVGVVDVSNPSSPQKVRTVPASKNVYCVAVCGAALYAGFNYSAGADIFSLADPASPLRSKSLGDLFFCDMENVDNTLYVAGRDFGAHSMEITDPLNPTRFTQISSGHIQRIAAAGNKLGLTDKLSGVELYTLDPQQNISTPFSYPIGFTSLIMYAHNTTLDVSDYFKGLKILDCSNPGKIVDHGFIGINAADIAFAGDVACMARGPVVEFWSAADPGSLVKIRSFDLPQFRNRLFLHGPYGIFYLGSAYAGSYGVTLLDLHNPGEPELLSDIPFTGPVHAAAVGNALFVIDENKQLLRIDISDARNPVAETAPVLPDSVEGFWIRDTIGYCTTSAETLIILDLTDPFHPQPTYKTHSGSCRSEPLFYGEYAYSSGFLGMTVYDFSDPWHPRETGFVAIPGYFASPAILGDNLAVLKTVNEEKISFYNLSTPNAPQKLGCVTLTGVSSAVAARGPYAFVANNAGGLKILDLGSPEARELGAIIGRNDVVDVAVQNDLAYLGVTAGGLYIIDITQPDQPGIIGHYYPSTNSNLSEVLVSGQYAYLIGGVYQFSVIDVANPAQPRLAGKTSASYDAGSGDIGEGFVYLADKRKGLTVYDVRDPRNPQLAGETPVNGLAQNLCVRQGYAYVSVALGPANPSAIHIFDLSTPDRPVKIDSVMIPSADFRGLAASGNHLIAAASYRGAYIFDLSDPVKPVNVGQFYTSGNNIIDVAVADGHIFCCDAENGIYRVSSQLMTSLAREEESLPEEFGLEQNYPNPFNAHTTISYRLGKTALVQLAIYNLKGELVRTLIDERQNAGLHLADWDGRTGAGLAAASGLYLAAFKAADRCLVRKMLLVR